MQPAVKHWLFFAFLLLTLAAMVALVLYQWSRLDEAAPASAPDPSAEPPAPVPGPADGPPAAAEPSSRLPGPASIPPAA